MLNNIYSEYKNMQIRKNSREQKFGVFINELVTPSWGPILDSVGYDFCIFDMEHGRFSISDLGIMLPSFRASRAAPFLRVPTISREFFQAPLDMGLTGIVVPMVESADEVRAATSLMKYGPRGRRGVAFGRPHTDFYSNVDREKVICKADESVLLVIQIETKKGVQNLEKILDVPGIDILFIGNTDLAQSLQCENDLSGGMLRENMEKILCLAREKNIPCGGNFTSSDAIKEFGEKGLQFISLTTDVELLQTGMSQVHPRMNSQLRSDFDTHFDLDSTTNHLSHSKYA
ncbi:MAG: aldolase/citrate lyase family protein [Planctomycetia bacterium]|nr:aldolase/citrate lyase family protein [Planctomycetia bacterium]